MLRKIRQTLAVLFVGLIALLFLDFTGTVHAWFGWMAKIQFLPAVLAMNVAVIVLLVALTLIFGRVYCSIICPLGVLQDLFAWMGRKQKKNRYSFSPAINWLRYGVLALFVAALVAGVGSFVALLAPYSSFGRIVTNLFAPIYQWGNNLLAYFAERMDSYAFYETEVWMASLPTFIIALITLVVLVVLAWRGGRTYCNTICPVGTVLGCLSRFSWLAPVIDTEKCNSCGLCARNCKASCIDNKNHKIDYSRCVVCMDCIEKCTKNAISYRPRTKKQKPAATVDESRRSVLTATAILATTSVMKAQEKKRDGGLAVIEDKVVPERSTKLVPPGAMSIKNFEKSCTACQLCVSVCPNDVLRPSTGLLSLMQPEMSFENGYCRPECTKCSDVCPAGAIKPITKEVKSSTQIGHAVWIKKNCLLHEEVDCGKCMDACPTGAIQVEVNEKCPNKHKHVIINTERCIGCGACENLCPVRPLSAIYVEGHEVHREI